MKMRFGTVIAVVVPLALAIVLGMMCMTQYRHRELALKQQQNHQDSLNALLDLKSKIDSTPLVNKDIAKVDTPDEQAAFLTQLRVNAAAAGVKLVSYNNLGMVVPPPQQDQKPAPQSIFRPVASTLTVQGRYLGVRAFAYSLLRANRLMNMNGVTWKRDTDGGTTTLSFTLIRYVTDPSVQVETKPVSMPTQGDRLEGLYNEIA